MTVKCEVHEITADDPRYPEQLAATPWPPETLYVMGDPAVLEPGLGVIGARRATPTGLRGADLFAGRAAAAGFVIVSGGAVGCDQAAHRAALAAGGRTVAVMAGGADVSYPRGAAPLLREIASRGALVSEHPWGTEPKRWMFRTRNRIIAGLSAALLVIEAKLPSGTFSTADYALAASREVLALPGSIYAPESRGTNRLISQGAVAITEMGDLEVALTRVYGRLVMLGENDVNGAAEGESDPLLAAVRACPSRPDELSRDLGVDVVSVSRRLGLLEARDLIARYRDGRYGPVPSVRRDTIATNPDKGVP